MATTTGYFFVTPVPLTFFHKLDAFAEKTKPSFRVLMGIFSLLVRVKNSFLFLVYIFYFFRSTIYTSC